MALPGMSKQCRPRSDCSNRSSLIRVYSVCYSICIFWMHYSVVEPPCLTFRIITPNFSGVRFFRKFMVIISSTQFFNFMVYYVECSVRLSALGIMGRIRDLSSTAIYQPVSDKCFTTIHISSGKVKIWLQNSITCILIHQRSLKSSATLRNSTITPLQ